MHQVYVLKRPGVDTFMKRVGEIFEVVVFTASLAKVPPHTRPTEPELPSKQATPRRAVGE